MKLTTSEASLQKAAIGMLQLYGFPTYRINSGHIEHKSGRMVRLAPAGFSDLVAIVPGLSLIHI